MRRGPGRMPGMAPLKSLAGLPALWLVVLLTDQTMKKKRRRRLREQMRRRRELMMRRRTELVTRRIPRFHKPPLLNWELDLLQSETLGTRTPLSHHLLSPENIRVQKSSAKTDDF